MPEADVAALAAAFEVPQKRGVLDAGALLAALRGAAGGTTLALPAATQRLR